MKLVRDNKIYSQQRALMLKNNSNFITAYGKDVTLRSLNGNYPTVSILTSECNYNLAINAIKAANHTHQIYVFVCSREVFQAITGVASNAVQCIASIVDMRFKELDFILKKKDRLLLLEDVRSSDNIGSLIRTAWSLGISNLVVTETTAAGINARSARTSLGALFQMNITSTKNLVNTIKTLHASGYHIYGTSPNAEESIVNFRLSELENQKMCGLVVGNEQHGSTDDVLNQCYQTFRIPQANGDSLTISHAAAISIYALIHQI